MWLPAALANSTEEEVMDLWTAGHLHLKVYTSFSVSIGSGVFHLCLLSVCCFFPMNKLAMAATQQS